LGVAGHFCGILNASLTWQDPLETDLDQIIGSLYDTALEPEAWASLGPRLAGLFEAASFLVYVQRPHAPLAELFETNWPGQALADYAAHYFAVDCWRTEGFRQPQMSPVIGDRVVPETDFVRSEVYADLARPMGLHHMLGEWAVHGDGALCSVALHRSKQRGAFDEADARLLGTLFPHFLRSVRLRQNLQAAHSRAAIGDAALDGVATGVVVTQADGRVLLANRTAEGIAERNDGFMLQACHPDRAVAAARSEDTQRLRALIASAASHLALAQAGGALHLPSRSGKRGYAVTVTPVPRTLRGLNRDRTPLALLLIADLECQPVPFDQRLVAVFGLTPAEARLVAALARGESRSAYAARACVAQSTIKTQLASVFTKLGVKRESELVRMALALPGP
jgi:DNA-binding CsgD family transcriptional regulator/PAS domain-containing protein